MNVAELTSPSGGYTYIDLVVENRSAYTPYNLALNGFISQQFAAINVACNTAVDLRVSMRVSCATAPSCVPCFSQSLTSAEQIACFASGCACYGTTVFTMGGCVGQNAVDAQANYLTDTSCQNNPLTLPREALVTMTVYNFDTINGDYRESLTVEKYVNYKTPLRPMSRNDIPSFVSLDADTRTFTVQPAIEIRTQATISRYSSV